MATARWHTAVATPWLAFRGAFFPGACAPGYAMPPLRGFQLIRFVESHNSTVLAMVAPLASQLATQFLGEPIDNPLRHDVGRVAGEVLVLGAQNEAE